MKLLNQILFAVFLVVVAAAAIHFVRSYQRLTAQRPEVAVTIPEGFTMYDIDRVLNAKGVLAPGAFVATVQSESATSSLEGMLFPDTYYFYTSSTATSVVEKFLNNFNDKAGSLLAGQEQNLIIASLVQKEVASSTDMAVVAGILEKRLAAGMYLNVDAALCYEKQIKNPTSTAGCYPITAADLKTDSPYNTYLHKGLPPTAIGNPGVEAITATLHPQSSTYWYYLSDPKTGQTIYANTLTEQEANQKKYLR